ncbi:MAG: ABC transporter ATP-binding protein [Lachnospiraceae bacterium]|nr:ABC transporter ATP-binding protein [Lachnospiraceae bacterium]
MILRLEHIYKDYNLGKLKVPALKDVTLEVEKGEYLAVMGPSGSGKSTLMNIIGCLDRPTSGSYELSGQNVMGLSDSQLADVRLRSLGFVFQNFQLLPRMTALDNVALPLVYAGVRKKVRRQKAREALIRVGLEERISFKPTQLSGGQKQRVAIARAMVNNPDILLADEPTGALDSKSGAQVMELFQSLNDEGVTVIMITHDRNIANHAKRMVEIFDGELIERRSPDSQENSQTRELYSGTGDSDRSGEPDGSADPKGASGSEDPAGRSKTDEEGEVPES